MTCRLNLHGWFIRVFDQSKLIHDRFLYVDSVACLGSRFDVRHHANLRSDNRLASKLDIASEQQTGGLLEYRRHQ